MSLKSRLTIIYTLFVSGLIFIVFLVIYLLNSNSRETQFFNKLSQVTLKNNFTNISESRFQQLQISDGRFLHLNANNGFIHIVPQTLKIVIDTAIFSKLKTLNKYQWYDNENRQ